MKTTIPLVYHNGSFFTRQKDIIGLCSSGLHNLFYFPAGTKKIDLVLSTRPLGPNSYRVEVIDTWISPTHLANTGFRYRIKLDGRITRIQMYSSTVRYFMEKVGSTTFYATLQY